MVGTCLKLFQFEGSRASIFEQKWAIGWWNNHTKPVRNVILPCKCEKCHFSGAIFKLATVTWRQPFSFSWSPGNYHVSMILTKHSSFIVELGPWETWSESRNHILWFKIPWSIILYCLLQAAQAAVWDPANHHHSSPLQPSKPGLLDTVSVRLRKKKGLTLLETSNLKREKGFNSFRSFQVFSNHFEGL